jgi:CRISPR type III-B/RAMP module RAMP protein Cmr6
MSQIPITRDYAAAVGDWCEQVENRSLLLNKFAFPKNWGDDNKENSASFWSLMRVAANGSALLTQKAADLERRANGRNIETQDKADRLRREAQHCRNLAGTAATGAALDKLRAAHTARFLELLRATYTGANLRVITARLEGRLAINLAEGLIQNGGINLDRIFGLPLINGSSIKGVARTAALEELKNATAGADQNGTDEKLKTFVRVFGAGESDWKGDLARFADIDRDRVFGHQRLKLPLAQKGAVVFLQATPVNAAQIVVDITNVHTPDYYRTGNARDLANERPQPHSVPAVERDAEFAFPILLNAMSNDTALLEAAHGYLKKALEQNGLGAKTAAGYGWFTECERNYLETFLDKQKRIRDEQRKKEEEERRKREIEAAFVAEKNALPKLDDIAPENLRPAIATVKAFLTKYNGRDGLQQIRGNLASNRRRLPQQSPADQLRERWERENPRSIINGTLARFRNLSDDQKSAIVHLLRETNGIGATVWNELKQATKGDRIAAANEIRAYCKNTLKLGKMP